MHNDFSGPTLKLEFEFQLGRKRKIRTFRSVHPSIPFSEMAALEAAMQSRSLEQAAGTGQQSRYPQPATSSSAPPPHAPSAPPSLPPPATGAAAAAQERPKGCCRAPRPTGSPQHQPQVTSYLALRSPTSASPQVPAGARPSLKPGVAPLQCPYPPPPLILSRTVPSSLRLHPLSSP